MQAGGHRFDSVHLHQNLCCEHDAVNARFVSETEFRVSATYVVCRSVLFDIVKRSEPDRIRPVRVHRFGNGSVAETNHGFPITLGERVSRLSPVHGNLMTQAREGHLVDALALRGDEGRSTLR